MSAQNRWCGMCGWTVKSPDDLQNRWYQYDNGEQFIAAVCSKCQTLHQSLVGAK